MGWALVALLGSVTGPLMARVSRARALQPSGSPTSLGDTVAEMATGSHQAHQLGVHPPSTFPSFLLRTHVGAPSWRLRKQGPWAEGSTSCRLLGPRAGVGGWGALREG